MAPEIKARNCRRSGPYGRVSQRRARVPGACEATGDFFRSLLGLLRSHQASAEHDGRVAAARAGRFVARRLAVS